jgi:hypothetical protein
VLVAVVVVVIVVIIIIAAKVAAHLALHEPASPWELTATGSLSTPQSSLIVLESVQKWSVASKEWLQIDIGKVVVQLLLERDIWMRIWI